MIVSSFPLSMVVTITPACASTPPHKKKSQSQAIMMFVFVRQSKANMSLAFFVLFVALAALARGEVTSSFKLENFAQANMQKVMGNGLPPQSSVGSLQLTSSVANSGSSVWFKTPVLVRGFCSNFTFSISAHSTGMAFVIQTATKQTGVLARPNGPGLGYGTASLDEGAFPGIPRSVAVEFDTFHNAELGDKDDNHVSVHTLKDRPNTAFENLTLVQGYVHDGLPPFVTPAGSSAPQKVAVSVCYRPWKLSPSGLTVAFQSQVGYAVHKLTYPLKFNLSALLNDVATSNGQAFIGFTATTLDPPVAHVLWDWSYEFLGNVRDHPEFIQQKGPGVLHAVAGAGANFSLALVDQFHNPYIAQLPPSALLVMLDGSTDPSRIAVRTPLTPPPVSGVYQIWYNATRTGRAAVVVEVFGNQVGVTGVPLTPLVASAPADAEHAFPWSGPGVAGETLRVSAGQTVAWLVQTQDRFGNNCTDFAAAVSLNITSVERPDQPAVETTVGAVPAGPLPPDGGWPVWTGVFRAATGDLLASGHYQVYGWVNGDEAPRLAIGPGRGQGARNAYLTILNLGPDAGQSTADFGLSTASAPEIVAGRPHTVVVTLRDQYGNALIDPVAPPGTGDQLTFLFNGEPGLSQNGHHCDQVGKAQEKETNPGVFVLAFQCKLAGKVAVDVRLAGQSLQGMPFGLTVVSTPECDPGQSLAWGPALGASVVAGPHLPFSFQPVDPFGNNITVALLYNGTGDPHNKTPLQASNAGKPFPLTVAPLNNGLLAVSYDAQLAQRLQLHLTWAGRDIRQPERTVLVVPGPTSPRHCRVSGAGLVGALDGQAGECLVEARDQFGNEVRADRREFFRASLAAQSGASRGQANVTDNGNGTYSVTYVARDTGDYWLNITLNGQPVAKSPYKVVVEWAGFSNSSVLIVGCIVVLLLIVAVVGFFSVRYHRRKQYFNL